jgi:hypothetical protein
VAKSATVRAPHKNSDDLPELREPPKDSNPLPLLFRVEYKGPSPSGTSEGEKDVATMPGDFGPTKQEILQLADRPLAQALALVAERFGLDPEEADLALRYAAAAKEAAQRALTATPEEATRLKGMKRLASLTLDLYQRLKVAVLLPRVLTDERQADLASQLSGTSYELRKLEKNLFGKSRTPQDNLITKATARRMAWLSPRPNPMPKTENAGNCSPRPGQQSAGSFG